MADELETCAFAKLGEMKVVRCLALRRRPYLRCWRLAHRVRSTARAWVLAVVLKKYGHARRRGGQF